MSIVIRAYPLVVVFLSSAWIAYIGFFLFGSDSDWAWREFLGAFLAVVGFASYYRESIDMVSSHVKKINIEVDEKGVASVEPHKEKLLVKHVRNNGVEHINIRHALFERQRQSLSRKGIDLDYIEYPGAYEYRVLSSSISYFHKYFNLFDLGEARRELNDKEVVTVLLKLVEMAFKKSEKPKDTLYSTFINNIKPLGMMVDLKLYTFFNFTVDHHMLDSIFVSCDDYTPYASIVDLPKDVLLNSFYPSLLLSAKVIEDEVVLGGGNTSTIDYYQWFDSRSWRITTENPVEKKELVLGKQKDELSKDQRIKLQNHIGNSSIVPLYKTLSNVFDGKPLDSSYIPIKTHST